MACANVSDVCFIKIHMAHFLDLSDMDPGGLEPAWIQLGNAVRLSQSVSCLFFPCGIDGLIRVLMP